MIPKFNNIYKFNKLTHKRGGIKHFCFTRLLSLIYLQLLLKQSSITHYKVI